MRAAARPDDVRTYLASVGIALSYSAVRYLCAPAPCSASCTSAGTSRTSPRGSRSSTARCSTAYSATSRRVGVRRSLIGSSPGSACFGARLRLGDGRRVQKQQGKPYYYYRCGNKTDCTERSAISATIAEREVVKAVRAELADAKGRASIESTRRGAELELEVAQQALDSAIRTLAAVADEPAAIERLAELRAERDAARDRLEQHGTASGSTLALTADRDWDDLTIDEQRALIRATVHVVVIRRGRGLKKIMMGLYGDDADAKRILSAAARRILGA